VRRGGALAAGRGAALEHDEGLGGGDVADPGEEGAAVTDAFDVRESDAGRGVGGVVLEEVGDGDRGGVPGGHGAADTDAGGAGEVLERGHEVAGLADDSDRARWRVRGDDLGAEA